MSYRTMHYTGQNSFAVYAGDYNRCAWQKMNTTDYSILANVLDEHGMVCAVVIGRDGAILARVGDCENSKVSILLSGLVGPYGDAKVTFDSFHGQLLPRIWGQGDTYAFIHKPTENLAVITIGIGKTDARTPYEKSKTVDLAIAAVIKKIAQQATGN